AAAARTWYVEARAVYESVCGLYNRNNRYRSPCPAVLTTVMKPYPVALRTRIVDAVDRGVGPRRCPWTPPKGLPRNSPVRTITQGACQKVPCSAPDLLRKSLPHPRMGGRRRGDRRRVSLGTIRRPTPRPPATVMNTTSVSLLERLRQPDAQAAWERFV